MIAAQIQTDSSKPWLSVRIKRFLPVATVALICLPASYPWCSPPQAVVLILWNRYIPHSVLDCVPLAAVPRRDVLFSLGRYEFAAINHSYSSDWNSHTLSPSAVNHLAYFARYSPFLQHKGYHWWLLLNQSFVCLSSYLNHWRVNKVLAFSNRFDWYHLDIFCVLP